jgi:hypothetical protein
MLTKALAVIVMTGALWVTGDAAYRKFGCPMQYLGCCHGARESCSSETKQNNNEGSSSENKTPECCHE